MDNKCGYCTMHTDTPYGTRGSSFGGGFIYSFIANNNIYTMVCGSNSHGHKILYCPICGKKLEDK